MIIDGKSVFYRGYYAMPGLLTKDGIPTGGVYGFTTLSLEVIKRLQPNYVAVAWDKAKTNIRSRLKIYPQYKAGRKPPPADFYAQIPILHELLDSLGWPMYELDDYEADDIMAALAVQAKDKNIETILITSDLDALQCINNLTKVYALKKGLSNIEEFHPESFVAKYGIQPHQFLDLKSLMGDSSDNIPGVPGVGEKTALELLKKYGTLDEIYDNIELINNSVKIKLINGRELAYMSKKLATLFVDAPIKLDLKAMDVTKFDGAKLKTNLEKLEFRSLLRQMPEVLEAESELAQGIAPGGNLRLPRVVLPNIFHCSSKEVLYIHCFGRGTHGANPYAVVLGTKEQATTFELPRDKDLLIKIKPVLESTPLVGYDIKHHIKSLLSLGIEATRVDHDVQVAAFLLDSLQPAKTLHDLAVREIGYQLVNVNEIPPEDISHHSAELIGILHALHIKQIDSFGQYPKMADLAKKIEWPVIPVLALMEYRGIGIDTTYLGKMGKQLADQISDLEQAIYGFADQEFNIASPQQLAVVLFEDMGLPAKGIKKGKTGYSTAAGELDKLRGLHPIINSISQFREYTKLKNTYVDALPKLATKDNRIHTTFNLTVAQTGRLSSSDPNLQNIPVRSDLGRSIRRAFIAGKDNVFISADYSQFELRLAAVMAGDTDMMEVFNGGEDIHTRTASEVYGIALEDVTKEQRSNAKTINFGVLYGMSPHGLAAATGMTYGDAQEFIDRYFATRQPLVDYIATLKEHALKSGFVATVFGRRRPTPDVKSTNFIVREAALRQAVNMPIQGTEADLMKLAMVAVDKILPKDCYQLLQVHDSILVECPVGKAEKLAEQIKETMENIYPGLGIVLAVDIHIGQNWGEL